MLGLRFCARAFSICGKWGPFFIAVRGPLLIAASLVEEHRLQTRRLTNEETEVQRGTDKPKSYSQELSEQFVSPGRRSPRSLARPGHTGEAPSWRGAWEWPSGPVSVGGSFADPFGALPPFSPEGF